VTTEGYFIAAVKREMAALKDDERRRIPLAVYGHYALLENFNLGKYRNSELAWTMNHNNSLPAWRIHI